jgi:hypothetical protein
MMISDTHIERKKRQDQDNAIKYYLKSSRILSLDAWKTYYSNKSQPFEIFQVWESKNEETSTGLFTFPSVLRIYAQEKGFNLFGM